MAIEKKLIHFKTYSNFSSMKLSANEENTQYTLGPDGEVQEGSPDIKYQSICYIKDSLSVWTHGLLYNSVTSERIEEIIASSTTIEDLENKLDNYSVEGADNNVVTYNSLGMGFEDGGSNNFITLVDTENGYQIKGTPYNDGDSAGVKLYARGVTQKNGEGDWVKIADVNDLSTKMDITPTVIDESELDDTTIPYVTTMVDVYNNGGSYDCTVQTIVFTGYDNLKVQIAYVPFAERTFIRYYQDVWYDWKELATVEYVEQSLENSNSLIYDDIINIDTTSQTIGLNGTIDESLSESVGSFNFKGYNTKLFSYDTTGTLNYPSGNYKLMYNNEHVGDCIITDSTITINKIPNSKYYFNMGFLPMLNDGEEYYGSTYYTIFMLDSDEFSTFSYPIDPNIINRSPYKNDPITYKISSKILQGTNAATQGLTKILSNYVEGIAKYGNNTAYGYNISPINLLPTIAGNIAWYNIYEDLNSPTEVSNVYLDEYTWVNVQDYCLINNYISRYITGGNKNYLCPRKTINIINDGTEKFVNLFLQLVIGGSNVLGFEEGVYNGSMSYDGSDTYGVTLKPYEKVTVEIIVGKLSNEDPNLAGPVYSDTEMFVYLYRDTEYATKDIATQTSNGLMSAEDKTKLDTITSGNISIVSSDEYAALETAGALEDGVIYYIK